LQISWVGSAEGEILVSDEFDLPPEMVPESSDEVEEGEEDRSDDAGE
jgi:hypothetical protein